MISFTISGSFKNSSKFFNKIKDVKFLQDKILRKYADKGLQALIKYTPQDTGKTRSLWQYTLSQNGITYTNDNINNGIPIVVLLQYGHATRGGGYVQGIDFINPALRPIFDKIVEDYWKEVTS